MSLWFVFLTSEQVFASDADSGVNGQIEYSILSGNNNGAFILDSLGGILATNVALDREITSSYKYACFTCNEIYLDYLHGDQVRFLISVQ